MRILCRHGHFAFYPQNDSGLSRFSTYFNLALEQVEDYFTFPLFSNPPAYSLAPTPWLGGLTTAAFSGKPWEIMRENQLVYSLSLKALVHLSAVGSIIELSRSTHYYLNQNRLVQPGSLLASGARILSYDAIFNADRLSVRILGYKNG